MDGEAPAAPPSSPDLLPLPHRPTPWYSPRRASGAKSPVANRASSSGPPGPEVLPPSSRPPPSLPPTALNIAQLLSPSMSGPSPAPSVSPVFAPGKNQRQHSEKARESAPAMGSPPLQLLPACEPDRLPVLRIPSPPGLPPPPPGDSPTGDETHHGGSLGQPPQGLGRDHPEPSSSGSRSFGLPAGSSRELLAELDAAMSSLRTYEPSALLKPYVPDTGSSNPHGQPLPPPNREAPGAKYPLGPADTNISAPPYQGADPQELTSFLSGLKSKYRLGGSGGTSTASSARSSVAGQALPRHQGGQGRQTEEGAGKNGGGAREEETCRDGWVRQLGHVQQPAETAQTGGGDKIGVEADGPLCFCRLRSQEGGKAEDSEWEEVNRLLDCQGLGRLPQRPTLADVRSALTSALEELRLRGRTSAEALAEARRRDGDVLEAAERREAMLREEKRKAAEAANAAEAEADRLRQGALKAEARARRTEAESTGLRRQLAAAEANTRGKEREIEKLRAAVMQKVDREEAVAARHKDAYARLRRGVEGHRRSKELRAEEIAGIYQEQVDAALSEAVAARTEAARMAAEVREAENTLKQLRSVASRVNEAEAAMEEFHRESQHRVEEASARVAEALKREAELQERLASLAEENAALVMEMDHRPTSKELHDAHDKAEALQRRIQDLEAAVSNADSRALAVQESLGGLSDREKMRRDRDIHRLRLGAVARLPKSSAVALLQDTCIAAELSDAEQLPSAVAKLTRVVAAVPKMEAFISRCCEAVFRRGCAFLPKGGEEGMDYDYSPHRVPEVLDHWLKQLGRLAELEEMRSAVAGHLAMRVVSGGGTPNLHPFTSTAEVIYAVKRLVDGERAAMKAADTIAAAEEMMQDPAGLLQKLVSRFQELFDCPKLDHVLATINQVYMSLEEARNFRRNLVDLLGLEDGSTAAACIEAVQRLLDHHARHLGLKANYLNRLEADQEAHRVERREREQVARGPKSTRAPEGWELPTSFFQSPVVAIPSRSSRWTPSPELRAERTRAPRHLYRDRDVSRSF